MFGSSKEEKKPLVGKQDPKAKSALDQLSSSFGDAESPYMSSQAPAGKQQTLQEKAAKELKQRWWLWGSIAFTVLLLSSLFVFRGYLYDTATHGLPFLAVKEAAAEECASQCRDLASPGKAAEAASADSYDACYAKCVAQETKEIAAERVEFKKDEEALDQTVAEKGAAAVKQAAEAVAP